MAIAIDSETSECRQRLAPFHQAGDEYEEFEDRENREGPSQHYDRLHAGQSQWALASLLVLISNQLCASLRSEHATISLLLPALYERRPGGVM